MADPAGVGADPIPKRSVASWILYDMANTVFSFNIVSLYYALWLKDQPLAGFAADTVFAIGNTSAMAVVFLLAPVLGALSDRVRRRVPILAATTVLCILFTFPLGLVPWQVSLVFFVVANIGFQLGLVVYDSLLPIVSTPANRGRIGALGVGIGYMGSLAGLAIGSLILANDENAEPLVFIATATAFLVLALPAFFFIKEPARDGIRIHAGAVLQSAKDSFRGLARLVRGNEFPQIRRFLFARVFYTDAANTMIIFMALYATLEVGFSDEAVQGVLLCGILGAAALAYPFGVLVDRVGPKNTLDLVLLVWMFGLTIVILMPILDLPQNVFYALAFILGGALGGTWTADRPLLVRLVPPDRIGEFYGIYAMIGRFAAVLGPIAWALVVEPRFLNLGRPAAVATLLGFMILSFALLRKLKDPVHPDTNPLGPLLPWTDGSGRRHKGVRRFLSFPFLALYLVVSWILFVPNAEKVPGAWVMRPGVLDDFTYRIPDLSQDLPRAAMSLVTAPWVNHDSIQLGYVTILLLLFGFIVESREGTRRTLLVFFGATLAGAVVAGLLLHVIYPSLSDDEFFRTAWERSWSGGSVGAFGLMGALAARARRPWALLAFFVVWELNVGFWYLRSYTPAFHLTALATGFALTRYALKPIRTQDAGTDEPGQNA